ncbi:dipeptide/oligopeptide/nickel ABC transporter permease/ATP-binding protein [Acetobacteraceae bacterium H6797]|nr:dipeptide/oligopeptide/nickel ABC transporter permease/ATP-binding protein [Acetobacteraceae bacterium H6797]
MRRKTLLKLIPSGTVVAIIAALAILAPVLPLQDVATMDVNNRLAPASAAHWLGQDEYGRDVLTRLIWGARISLAVALISTAIAAMLGTALGLIGGYFRGLVEILTVRVSEAVLCFPPLLLALMIVTLFGPGMVTLVAAMSILYAPSFARIAFAETLTKRGLDYVSAQESLGVGPARIMWRTVLPNIAPPLLVKFSLTIASAMVLESGLSFLGLGVVPPTPSWGLMVRGARATMETNPMLLVWPCLALAGTVMALNAFCDALRDAMDPRGATEGGLGLGWKRPAPAPMPQDMPGETLLDIRDMTLTLGTESGPLPLVRNVSLKVARGETLALVGESGSGKSLTGSAAMGLLPSELGIANGHILFRGRDGVTRDLARQDEPALRRLRGRDIAMVFQDPGATLDPVWRIGTQIAEAIRAHRPMSKSAAWNEAVELLRRVGLPDPERKAKNFPHELSGGQKQRVMIAAAVANAPRLLIADEPTTALDVTIQAQILDMFAALKAADRDMGMIFISHNLAVVARIADRVAVMYAGRIVEEGPVREVFEDPRHPYTAGLLASAPESESETLTAIPGVVPQPRAMPPGCAFAPRCSMAIAACKAAVPPLTPVGPGRASACIRAGEMGQEIAA